MSQPVLNNMFPQSSNSRKRAFEEDDVDVGMASFSDHRAKRQMAALPHRTSPRQSRQLSSPFGSLYPIQPAPPIITPADSDEETPVASEPKSFFSPYSSSPTQTLTPDSPTYYGLHNSTPMSDTGAYSEDCEMADSTHLSPGPFQNDSSNLISNRIPTPIHATFRVRDIRAEKASRHHDPDFADDEAAMRYRQGRRLPSPISEGEVSPSFIVEGLGEMQMEVEHEPEKDNTPTKKGHSRSKHSLRDWTGSAGDFRKPGAPKRSFSMGYKADCEKCRSKVPGHFSHIVEY